MMKPTDADLQQTGPFSGWPDEARSLIEKAARRHGGWDRYRTLRRIRIALLELGGPLPFIKGLHRAHPPPPCVEVSPHDWRAVFHDYPRPGEQGLFDRGDVRIIATGQDGQVLREGKDHRRTFTGVRKLRRWDPLDALYFFGYALCTYQALPFVLAQTSFVSLRRVHDHGEELTGVFVDFSAELPSHSVRQGCYFDGTGLLRRHDYTADIVGRWANGAHYSGDYIDAGGLMVATRRWVVVTLLGRPTPIPVLHARFGEVTVE